MKLYLIRHGESETNLSGKWTGWFDAKLTESGRNDAINAGRFLEGVKFDKVLSSDLSRAKTTAELALPGYEIETTPLLREINVGTLAESPIAQTDRSLITDGYAYYGGESHEDFKERIREFLKVAETFDCENVAAFSHGGFIRNALNETIGIVLPGKKIKCNNCLIAVFEYKNGEWSLYSWINTK